MRLCDPSTPLVSLQDPKVVDDKHTPGPVLKPTQCISQKPPNDLQRMLNIQVCPLLGRDETGLNLKSVLSLQIPGATHLLYSMQLCLL